VPFAARVFDHRYRKGPTIAEWPVVAPGGPRLAARANQPQSSPRRSLSRLVFALAASVVADLVADSREVDPLGSGSAT
jgi:hypothetical protein